MFHAPPDRPIRNTNSGLLCHSAQDFGGTDNANACEEIQIISTLQIQTLDKESDGIGIVQILQPIACNVILKCAISPRAHPFESTITDQCHCETGIIREWKRLHPLPMAELAARDS